MKMRGAWRNVVKFVSAGTLVCGVLLFTVFGGAGKHGLSGKARSTPEGTGAEKPGNSRWAETYSKLPMSFEENMGQAAREVRYVSHGGKYELFLTSQEAVVALRPPGHLDFSPRHRFATLRAMREARRNAPQADRTTVLRLELEGANPQTQIAGTDPLPGKVNYFIGNDPKKWHTDVRTYAKVKYAGVYPGIDLIFYGNLHNLEYDFIVAPGANPEAIALKVKGARNMQINSRGDVIVNVPGGAVELQKPVIYQQVKGERREVVGRYVIGANHRITFSVPNYDRSERLILDPVLNYSTYVGGTSNDSANGIALDSNNDAFIVGASFSTDFPTTSNAFMPQPLATNVGGAVAAFVAELNPAGTTLLYSSYIAGSTPGEIAFGVAADPTGKAVYVTGQTFSPDFPTNSTITGFKTGANAGAVNGTSFLVKLDPTQATGANSFVYSTFIGGTNGTNTTGDLGQAVAADSNGVAYVVGYTDATPGTTQATFPVVNGFQTTLNNSNGNAFLAKIDTTKSTNALLYSTYLGGNGLNFAGAGGLGIGDVASGVAIDSSGKAYLVGSTSSTDFNTLGTTNGAFLTSPAGNTTDAAFFCQVDTTKVANLSLLYLTYLGGTGPDFGNAIALGPNNVAYLTGQTGSLNFPVSATAFQQTGSTSGVVFVSLIDTSLSPANSLTHSTFLGGNGGDDARGIQADSQGNAYIAGATSSSTGTGKAFPVSTGALQLNLAAGAFGNGYVSKLDPTLSSLLYSSYFGGSGNTNNQDIDTADGIAIDSSSPPNVYITGQTFSTNLPVAGTPVAPLHAGLNGTGGDAYVAKLSLIPTLAIVPTSLDFGTQPIPVTSGAKTVSLTNNTSDAIPFPGTAITFSGTNAADFASPSNTCGGSIAPGASCTVSVTFTPSVSAAETGTMVITVTIKIGGLSSSQAFDVSLKGTGSTTAPGVGLAPTSLAFGGQMLTTTSAAKTVTLTNTGLGPLTINSITDPTDFAQTNTCGTLPATLAAGANCTINVTFAPTVVGARTGTLTITDNANGSPHTVPLTGTGWDFTITAPSPQTVGPAAPLKFNATMTPLGGFNQAVALTCTGAPAGTTCVVVSPVTAADGMTAQTAQVTVTTTAMMVPPRSMPNPPLSIRQIVPLILALMLLFMVPRTKRLRVRLGLVTAMLMLVVLAGCGGGSKPPVNATLTITGSSTGTAGSVSHSATVALTIN